MAERAALVTGGSSGIGLAIARALGEDGYALTVAARRPEKLEAAANELREAGLEVNHVAAQMTEEADIVRMVAAHRERYGRLDVLVNSAGVGIGGGIDAQEAKKVDMQIDVNLRAVILTTREAVPLLKEAAAEHRRALIVNIASIAGVSGQGWLSVYAATKAGVINFTEATNKELGTSGIRATAFCPAFVDTPMTEWVRENVKPEDMIQPADLAEGVRFLLRLSPNCVVPQIVMMRPGETL